MLKKLNLTVKISTDLSSALRACSEVHKTLQDAMQIRDIGAFWA